MFSLMLFYMGHVQLTAMSIKLVDLNMHTVRMKCHKP